MNIQYAFRAASFYSLKPVSSETSLISFVSQVLNSKGKMQCNRREMLQKKCNPKAAQFVVVVVVEAGSGGDRSHVLGGNASFSVQGPCLQRGTSKRENQNNNNNCNLQSHPWALHSLPTARGFGAGWAHGPGGGVSWDAGRGLHSTGGTASSSPGRGDAQGMPAHNEKCQGSTLQSPFPLLGDTRDSCMCNQRQVVFFVHGLHSQHVFWSRAYLG